MTTPTDEVSQDLQQAYHYFNCKLFGATMPPCVVSYQREGGLFGFFRENQYMRRGTGKLIPEISVNPAYLPVRTLTETLATLVHQMVRYQHSLVGTRKSRSAYHNRELAELLKQVGLLPRVGGELDGAETGHRVGHVIVEGGDFDRACRALLAQGFAFSWVDRLAAALPNAAAQRETLAPVPPDVDPAMAPAITVSVLDPDPPPLPDAAYADLRSIIDYRKPAESGRRHKYSCGCDNFWGGQKIDALCRKCGKPFVDTNPRVDNHPAKRRRVGAVATVKAPRRAVP